MLCFPGQEPGLGFKSSEQVLALSSVSLEPLSPPRILGTSRMEFCFNIIIVDDPSLPQVPAANFCKLFVAFLLYLLAGTARTAGQLPIFFLEDMRGLMVQIHSFLTHFSAHLVLVMAARVLVSWWKIHGTISCMSKTGIPDLFQGQSGTHLRI